MIQVAHGHLLIDSVRIPSPTTKHATMVRALLINSAEFVEEVCRLRKKERTYSSMTFFKGE
jgi:hypothetical protein